MSDIPKAKGIIDLLLKGRLAYTVRRQLRRARNLMDREKPDFIVRRDVPKLTRKQALMARRLRRMHYGMNTISRRVGSQIGRVSEIVNGKKRIPRK